MSTMQRTAMQVLEDAIVKQRVLNGLALLEEKHGDGWVDKIDLETLNLGDEHSCVLGQVYRDERVDEEQARRWSDSVRGHGGETADVVDYLNGVDGYTRGIAIIDGPLLEEGVTRGPAQYGFDATCFYLFSLSEQSDETLAELGVTRVMVDDAIREDTDGGNILSGYVAGSYYKLEEEWQNAIVGIRNARTP